MGNPRALALCHHALGAVRYLQGRWPEALEALEESVALTRSFDGMFGEVIGEQRIAQVETALGRHEVARERLERALSIARRSDNAMVRAHSLGRILATLASNRFEAGDLGEAARYLARGFAIQKRVGECAGCDVLLYPAAVPIYIALGDLDLAEDACRKADEVASAFGSRSWVATARYLLGLLAAVRGDRTEAVERLEQSTEMFEALGQPYDAARSMEALATMLEGAPDAEARAADLRRRAADAYARLHGAPGVAPPAR